MRSNPYCGKNCWCSNGKHKSHLRLYYFLIITVTHISLCISGFLLVWAVVYFLSTQMHAAAGPKEHCKRWQHTNAAWPNAASRVWPRVAPVAVAPASSEMWEIPGVRGEVIALGTKKLSVFLKMLKSTLLLKALSSAVKIACICDLSQDFLGLI